MINWEYVWQMIFGFSCNRKYWRCNGLKGTGNTVLRKKGLKQIKNPLIQEIVDRQKFFLNGNINIHFTGFSIVPFINATIRYATMDEKIDMMKALLGSQESVYYSRKKYTNRLLSQ